MRSPAHTKYIILSILFVLATINFARTASEILENSKRLDELSQEVNELEGEKQNLEESVTYKKTDEYVEEKARNDLNLIRPGEKVYIIPKDFAEVDLESKVKGQKSLRFGELGGDAAGLSNPQKWFRLVFN